MAQWQKKCQEYDTKFEVTASYIETCKKDKEEMRLKLDSANSILQSLQNQDWSKQILDLKRENEFLRDEIALRTKDFQNLKQNLAIAI